jgi:hypothetical protein
MINRKMNGFFAYVLLAVVLSACSNNETKREPREAKELILQTEHCRYYCLSRNGYGNCKIVVCECDEGYTGDASVSW